MFKRFQIILLIALLSLTLAVGVSAVTTINTNIATGGTLTVTGTSTLSGVVLAQNGVDTAAAGTLTLGAATSTAITLGGSSTAVAAIAFTPTTAGTITLGLSSGTGTITISSSTAAQTVNIGSPSGVNGTSTINIGVGTNAVSTSTINIGDGVNANIKIGSGTAIKKHLSAEGANVTTAQIDTVTCGNLGTVTVTGAVVGDSVVATPVAVGSGIETTNLSWNATVTSNDTITIRACNPTAGNLNILDTQEWRVDVWQHF